MFKFIVNKKKIKKFRSPLLIGRFIKNSLYKYNILVKIPQHFVASRFHCLKPSSSPLNYKKKGNIIDF